MVYVFLANGFEEVEALMTVDMLRRAGLDVITVGIDGRVVNGVHDIMVTADIVDDQVHKNNLEAIILPGGMPGAENLDESPLVHEMIDYCAANGILIGAICAAPYILGKKGMLKGKRATAFPAFIQHLTGAVISNEFVCQDGNIITAKGMGVALEFSARLIDVLCGPEKTREIKAQIQCAI